MKIEVLWQYLINEGNTDVWYYDGSSLNNGPRIVALLDEHGGEVAHRTNPTDDKSWKMAGISHLKGFSELPEEALPILLSGNLKEDLLALSMSESTGRPQKMEKPLFYR